MTNSNRNDKANLDMAYQGIREGGMHIMGGVAVFGRHLWNLLMGLLKTIGLMPLFVRFWWLFIVLACALLILVNVVGVIFLVVAWCASYMGPKAENEFFVPLRILDPLEPISTE